MQTLVTASCGGDEQQERLADAPHGVQDRISKNDSIATMDHTIHTLILDMVYLDAIVKEKTLQRGRK
jgi:hypothetical protein